MPDPMDLFHGVVLGLGLQQLPRVLQALQKTHGMAGMTSGGAQGGQGQGGMGVPGMENIDPNVLLPLLLPLLQGRGFPEQSQGGVVPGVPRPPTFGGTAPPPPAMAMPPPSMGRIPSVPRVLPMSAGATF